MFMRVSGWWLLAFALLAVFWAPAPVNALSEKEYKSMLANSEEFRAADRELTQKWKAVNSGLKASDKKFLLGTQRDWLKGERDEWAQEYMGMGYSRPCAYAIAALRRVKQLDVFGHNLHVTVPGSEKDADAFWNEDEDIPATCVSR